MNQQKAAIFIDFETSDIREWPRNSSQLFYESETVNMVIGYIQFAMNVTSIE